MRESSNGFRFKLVLADSLYGESGCGFIDVLYELKLDFAVAIRSNHAVCYHRDKQFGAIAGVNLSVCFDGKSELRYIREIIYGKRRAQQFWELTTDPDTAEECNWCDDAKKYHQVGNLYGLRNWVEYGLKQSKKVGMGRFSGDKLCPD